ncbi:hypothetical protein, partial [Bradyrhizobium japonicum]|uniref:hypothetical protein n=1 Tax=Bradyrhizobium japonicum TaxID=375 RepID=UPI001E394805
TRVMKGLEALGIASRGLSREGREAVELPGCSRQRLHQCGKPQSSLTSVKKQVACRVGALGKASDINRMLRALIWFLRTCGLLLGRLHKICAAHKE